MLSPGVVVTGGFVGHSVLSPAVRVGSGSTVEGSVLLNGVIVGDGAQIRNAIIDKNVIVPPGAQIGFDHAHDEERGFLVQDGLTVLAQGPGRPRLEHAG